jgi:mannose-1-phosphate guanylyltransferase
LDPRNGRGAEAVSRYVAILAGGSGTRLWPLSRSKRPKQLLSLLGERSLIQSTVDRVVPLVGEDHIVIVTEASHADDVRAQLPELPPGHVLVEPARRGTAAAVGLGAAWISSHEPGATMASLHSDHVVPDPAEFRECLTAAFEMAESDAWLISLGVRASSPHTGMGYVQVGDAVGTFNGRAGHRAVRFVEKPDRATAERFMNEGYVWNTGMFVWSVPTILAAYEALLPEIHGPLMEISDALGTEREGETLRALYPAIPVQTIDNGIMERAERIGTVPSYFPWSDVGNWSELFQIAPKDTNGNAVQGAHLGLETRGSLIHAGAKPIFTMGVDDLVIVDLPDALLVCNRESAERLKELVDGLQADPRWIDLI